MRKWISLVEGTGDFPTLSFPKLYHIGSLDPSHKRKGSYEGEGVSVSLHPATWRSIARLGGNTLWLLRKKGNRFLDYHRLDKRTMMAWGIENGWVEESTVYQVCWMDEDDEEERCMTFHDEQEARAEFEDRHDWDETAKLVPVEKHLVGTKKLAQRCHQTQIDLDPLQLLATVWADDVLQLDGVWWEDNFAPHALSAPRGVIFLDRFSEWQKNPSNDWPDEGEDW